MTKIAIIGSSGHAGYALEGARLLEQATVVGISPGAPAEDISEMALRLSEEYRDLTTAEDYHEMLDATEPDFVVINTHFHLQSEVAAEALRRGCHVFVEKPVAIDIESLDALESVYNESKGSLIAMLGLRYDPAFYTAWKSVQEGSIGAVRLLHAQKSYRLGDRSQFYRSRHTYGGTIPWVGIHAIDWIQWFGGTDFISVDARHSTVANGGFGDLEASAACLFAMGDGVFATANIDYLRPPSASTHGDDRIRVAGSDGVIEVRDGKALLISPRTTGTEELVLKSPGNLFADFVLEVEGEGHCLLSAEDSFRATRLVLLARESADTGRTVPIGVSR